MAIRCRTGSIHCFRKVRRSSRMHQVAGVVCTQTQENAFLARCRSRWTQARWCLEDSICIIRIWCNRCLPTRASRRSFRYKLNKRLSLELTLLSTQTLVIIFHRMECLSPCIHPVTTQINSIKCMACKATPKTARSSQRTIWNRNRKTWKWAI